MAVALVITNLNEAPGLTRWGLRFAQAHDEKKLHILFALDAGDDAGLDETAKTVRSICGHCGEVACETRVLDHPNRIKAVLDEVRTHKPKLLLLAKQVSSKENPSHSLVDRRLFDRAPCATILLRLGDAEPPDHLNILIPTAGGPHSRAALASACRIAADGKGEITPLLVEPNVGEVAADVGSSVLDKVLKRAGIKLKENDNIHPRVIVANDVDSGLREVTKDIAFDLLIVGASGSGTVRRKLFGTVPDRLLKGSGGMTVAVIRRAKPVRARLQEKLERFLHLTFPQLRRDHRVALFAELQTKSRWSFDFMALTFLSTGIAAIGLIMSSTAVVIGAMLVAPLMTPLLGAGLALVQGNLPLMRSCIRSILYGYIGALGVGLVAGIVCPISELTPELLARGGPTLLDMGVAFLSGVAASYCIARPGLSSALAGVAIAAALVPPIATTGISLALAEARNSMGAALLFATNVVAIILGAAFNFYCAGIRSSDEPGRARLWAQRTIIGLVLACTILAIPLSSLLISGMTKHRQAPGLPAETMKSVSDRLRNAKPGIELVTSRLKPGNRKDGSPWVLELQVRSEQHPPVSLARELAALVSGKIPGAPEKIRVRLLTQLVTESE